MKIHQLTKFVPLLAAHSIIYFHQSRNYTGNKHGEREGVREREKERERVRRACQGLRSSARPYVCIYNCVCAEAPSALPGASLIFTQLHYPWQMEYICVRLLHGGGVGGGCGGGGADKCV